MTSDENIVAEPIDKTNLPQVKPESIDENVEWITMGGVDQHNATGKVLEALKDCNLPDDLHITVVMGPHAPWLKAVQRLATTMAWTTNVRTNVTNMAQLMTNSDLAIGAAGSTSWERCCLGLPCITMVLADNQVAAANSLAKLEAAILLTSASELSTAFEKLSPDTGLLASLSLKSQLLVDGKGTIHVTKELMI